MQGKKGDCIILFCCRLSLDSNIYFKHIKFGGDAIIDDVNLCGYQLNELFY